MLRKPSFIIHNFKQMLLPPSKLPNVGTTIFTVMSQLARQHNAINLSQGFPDFEGSIELIDLVSQYMKRGFNQYAPMAGVPQLTEAIAHKAHALYGISLDATEHITVTAGGTQALYTAIAAFVRPNDEVIVFEPCYDSYAPAIETNGGVVVPIALYAPDYRVPWSDVANAITPRTRFIIFNTPHNPSGTIWQASDLEALYNLVKDTNILLLSDEVYEHIIFDNQAHQSILRHPLLFERSLVVFSFGKTFHFTGWKIGYCIAPKALMAEFRKIHQFLVFSVNTPIQYAIADYLQNPHNYLDLSAFYQQKRDYFLKLIENSRFTWKPAQGSYFQLLDYSQITNETDTDFAARLTREKGIASIPISVFYTNAPNQKILRFCFAKRPETLEKAAEILSKL